MGAPSGLAATQTTYSAGPLSFGPAAVPEFEGVRASIQHGTNGWVVPGSDSFVSAWIGILRSGNSDFLQIGLIKIGAGTSTNCTNASPGDGKTWAFVEKLAYSSTPNPTPNPTANCTILTAVGAINPSESHNFSLQRCNGIEGQWCGYVDGVRRGPVFNLNRSDGTNMDKALFVESGPEIVCKADKSNCPRPHSADAVVGAYFGGAQSLAVNPNGAESCCPSWHTVQPGDSSESSNPVGAWSNEPISPGSPWNIHWINS